MKFQYLPLSAPRALRNWLSFDRASNAFLSSKISGCALAISIASRRRSRNSASSSESYALDTSPSESEDSFSLSSASSHKTAAESLEDESDSSSEGIDGWSEPLSFVVRKFAPPAVLFSGKTVAALGLRLSGAAVVLHCGMRRNSSFTCHSVSKSILATALYVCRTHQCGLSHMLERAHVIYACPHSVHNPTLLRFLQREYDTEITAKFLRGIFGERLGFNPPTELFRYGARLLSPLLALRTKKRCF